LSLKERVVRIAEAELPTLAGINASDEELCANPYMIYEQDRNNRNPIGSRSTQLTVEYVRMARRLFSYHLRIRSLKMTPTHSKS